MKLKLIEEQIKTILNKAFPRNSNGNRSSSMDRLKCYLKLKLITDEMYHTGMKVYDRACDTVHESDTCTMTDVYVMKNCVLQIEEDLVNAHWERSIFNPIKKIGSRPSVGVIIKRFIQIKKRFNFLKKLQADKKINYTVHAQHLNGSLNDFNEKIRLETIKQIYGSVDNAKEINAKIVTLHPALEPYGLKLKKEKNQSSNSVTAAEMNLPKKKKRN